MATYQKKLTKLKAYFSETGCLSCTHVLSGKSAVGYVSSAGGFWMALCKLDCEDIGFEGRIEGVHIFHLLEDDKDLLDAFSMPYDFTCERFQNSWKYAYERSDYVPLEGDLVAIPSGSRFVKLASSDKVQVYKFQNKIVTVTLDSTLQIIPVWLLNTSSTEFKRQLTGDEKLVEITKCELLEFARIQNLPFAAIGFLTGEFDYAAIL